MKRLTCMAAVFTSAFFLFVHCNGKSDGEDVQEEEDMAQEDTPVDIVHDEEEDDISVDPEPEETVDAEDAADYAEEEAELTPVERLCMSEYEIVCTYAANCCTPVEQAIFLMLGFNCENPTETALYTDCIRTNESSIEAGRSDLNLEAMERCREEQDAALADCPNIGLLEKTIYHTYVEHCQDVTPGLVEEGEFCWGSPECVTGFYCDMGTIFGYCRPVKTLGEECAENDECGEANVCADNQCALPGWASDPCDSDLDCDIGLWCNEGTCAELLAPGEECSTTPNACLGLCNRDAVPAVCVDYCDGV